MADNELDALTAALYVDFVCRRAVSDFGKLDRPKNALPQVREESEVDDWSDSHLDNSRATVFHDFEHSKRQLDSKVEPTRPKFLQTQGSTNALKGEGSNRLIEFNFEQKNQSEVKIGSGFKARRDDRDLKEVYMRKLKVKMVQQKIDDQRRVERMRLEARRKTELDQIRRERQHPLTSFITDSSDLFSTPFDYESAVQEQLAELHETSHIADRIEKVDSKLQELRRQRMASDATLTKQVFDSRSFKSIAEKPPVGRETDVQRWQHDRKERDLRLQKRIAEQQALEQHRLMEDLEAKKQSQTLKVKIRAAQSEARINAMNQDRYMRAEMNRYQSKVVNDLLRRPPTFFFYKASEEAISKVKQQLKEHKLEAPKMRLDEQVGRLQALGFS